MSILMWGLQSITRTNQQPHQATQDRDTGGAAQRHIPAELLRDPGREGRRDGPADIRAGVHDAGESARVTRRQINCAGPKGADREVEKARAERKKKNRDMRVLSARAGKNANSRKHHTGAPDKTAACVQAK